jgi:hypothetical protein
VQKQVNPWIFLDFRATDLTLPPTPSGTSFVHLHSVVHGLAARPEVTGADIISGEGLVIHHALPPEADPASARLKRDGDWVRIVFDAKASGRTDGK